MVAPCGLHFHLVEVCLSTFHVLIWYLAVFLSEISLFKSCSLYFMLLNFLFVGYQSPLCDIKEIFSQDRWPVNVLFQSVPYPFMLLTLSFKGPYLILMKPNFYFFVPSWILFLQGSYIHRKSPPNLWAQRFCPIGILVFDPFWVNSYMVKSRDQNPWFLYGSLGTHSYMCPNLFVRNTRLSPLNCLIFFQLCGPCVWLCRISILLHWSVTSDSWL